MADGRSSADPRVAAPAGGAAAPRAAPPTASSSTSGGGLTCGRFAPQQLDAHFAASAHTFSALQLTDDDVPPCDWILLLARLEAMFPREAVLGRRPCVDWQTHACDARCPFASLGAWIVCGISGQVHVCKSNACDAEIESDGTLHCALTGRVRQAYSAYEGYVDADEQRVYRASADVNTHGLSLAPTGLRGEREMIRMLRVHREDEAKATRGVARLELLRKRARAQEDARLAALARAQSLRSDTLSAIDESKLPEIQPSESRNRSRTTIRTAPPPPPPPPTLQALPVATAAASGAKRAHSKRKVKTDRDLVQLALARTRELMPRSERSDVLMDLSRGVVELWKRLQPTPRFAAYASSYTFAQHTLAALYAMQTGISRFNAATQRLEVLVEKHPAAAERMMTHKQLIDSNNLHSKKPGANPQPLYLPSRHTDATRTLKLCLAEAQPARAAAADVPLAKPETPCARPR